MKKVSLFFLFLILSLTPKIQAEVFRGEVTQINRADSTITLLYRDQNLQPVSRRVFRMPEAQDPAILQTLGSLEVGDELQVDARNINGTWEIQTFVSNPERSGGIVGAVGPAVGPGAAGGSGGTSPALTMNNQPVTASSRFQTQAGTVPVAASAGINTTTTTPFVVNPAAPRTAVTGNPVVRTVGGFAQPLPGTNDPPPTLSSSNQGARTGTAAQGGTTELGAGTTVAAASNASGSST